MARLFGVCCGLSTFSAVIFSGLLAGNPAEKIMIRALVGLAGGVVLGNAAGRVGMILIEDNLPEPKLPAEESAVTVESDVPPIVS